MSELVLIRPAKPAKGKVPVARTIDHKDIVRAYVDKGDDGDDDENYDALRIEFFKPVTSEQHQNPD